MSPLDRNFTTSQSVRRSKIQPHVHEREIDVGDTIIVWGTRFLVTRLAMIGERVRLIEFYGEEVE